MKKIFDVFKLDIDTKRIYGLDILRTAAILSVLLYHSIMLVPESIGQVFNYIYIDGVCMFFVLSGFLIGTILLKTAEKDGFQFRQLLDFWIRRWARTLPNYFLFLISLTLLAKIYVPGFPLRVVPQYLVFSQNLLQNPPGFFLESWSLSIEEWFYISVPLLLLVLLKISNFSIKYAVLFISITIIIFSIILRYVFLHNFVASYNGEKNLAVIARLDNIMYGVTGAYICFYNKRLWLKNKNIFFFIGCIIVITMKILSMQTLFANDQAFLLMYFYPLLCVGILFLLPFLSEYKIKNHNGFTKCITIISLISYSLYLINYSLIRKLIMENIFKEFFEGNTIEMIFVKNIFFWSSSILCSILIYKYFEVPTMKIRDKIKFK